MNLHERLRELRKHGHFTLKQAAAVADLSVRELGDLERGRTNPPLETLEALAHAYATTLGDILSGVNWSGPDDPQIIPPGLHTLMADPAFSHRLTPQWIRRLIRIEFRGQRPVSAAQWREVFLALSMCR